MFNLSSSTSLLAKWSYLSVTSLRVATLPRQMGTLIKLVVNLQFTGTWVKRFPSSRMTSSLSRNRITHLQAEKSKKPSVLANCVREGNQQVVPLTFAISFFVLSKFEPKKQTWGRARWGGGRRGKDLLIQLSALNPWRNTNINTNTNAICWYVAAKCKLQHKNKRLCSCVKKWSRFLSLMQRCSIEERRRKIKTKTTSTTTQQQQTHQQQPYQQQPHQQQPQQQQQQHMMSTLRERCCKQAESLVQIVRSNTLLPPSSRLLNRRVLLDHYLLLSLPHRKQGGTWRLSSSEKLITCYPLLTADHF